MRAQVGPLVPALVAVKNIASGRGVTDRDATRLFARRQVPKQFVPTGVLSDPQQAIGYRLQVALGRGDYVTGSLLTAPRSRSDRLTASDTHGARLVEIGVSGGTGLISQTEQGSLVDVVITSDRGGPPRTYLALQRVPVVQVLDRSADGSTSGGGSDRPVDANVVLRVTLRQAIMLTAAQNFAREIRVVPRPPGDRNLAPAVEVTPAHLRP